MAPCRRTLLLLCSQSSRYWQATKGGTDEVGQENKEIKDFLLDHQLYHHQSLRLFSLGRTFLDAGWWVILDSRNTKRHSRFGCTSRSWLEWTPLPGILA